MDQAITAFDWQRMLLGDEPPLFLLEIAFRTAVVYIYGLLLLRWLGSRTIGQLSTVEFLLVIALGSAIGDAMFYPDVPLVHALLVVTLVVFANKGLDILIARFKTAERAIDGAPQEVIRDGAFRRAFLKSITLGTSEIFQQLRERGVEHLGQVERAYLEADGKLTAFFAENPKPGLPIAPPWEIELPTHVDADHPVVPGTTLACFNCGTLHDAPAQTCSYCGHQQFTAARTELRFKSMDAG